MYSLLPPVPQTGSGPQPAAHATDRIRRRLLGPIAVAAALATMLPAAAFAALNLDGPATEFTGCLRTAGTIDKVAVGSSPKSPCSGGETEIHMLSGDITKVAAGIGLTGGGSTGPVSLELGPTYRLPQECAAGQVPVRAGFGLWGCRSIDAIDAGSVAQALGPLTADYVNPGNCQTYGSGEYVIADGVVAETDPGVNLVPGKYRPVLAGQTRWWMGKSKDQADGEGFFRAFVQIEVIDANDKVVSSWARTATNAGDGTSLPYDKDFASFTTIGGWHTMRITAWGAGCSKSYLRDVKIEFERVD